MGPETAGEILALVTAVSEAHAEAKRAGESDADTGGTSLRAKAWIREVQHLLSWAERQTNLSGGDPLSTDVQRLGRAYHKDKKNAASLAQWIINYSVAARENLAALATVPGFSEALLDEGDRLWKPLLAVRRGRPAGSDAYREALRRRRGLTHLLADRVRRVRSAARFVFRHHPDIRRQAMSEFERRRRQGQRKGT